MNDLIPTSLTAEAVKIKGKELGADLIGIADGALMDQFPPDPENPRTPSHMLSVQLPLHHFVRPASTLRAEFAEAHPCLREELDALPEEWCDKRGAYAHTGAALGARYRKFTAWLQTRPERNVIVVAHHNVFLGSARRPRPTPRHAPNHHDPHITQSRASRSARRDVPQLRGAHVPARRRRAPVHA